MYIYVCLPESSRSLSAVVGEVFVKRLGALTDEGTPAWPRSVCHLGDDGRNL